MPAGDGDSYVNVVSSGRRYSICGDHFDRADEWLPYSAPATLPVSPDCLVGRAYTRTNVKTQYGVGFSGVGVLWYLPGKGQLKSPESIYSSWQPAPKYGEST